MKCHLLLVSDYLLVDLITKRVTAFNILESFASNVYPVVLRFGVLIMIERDKEEPENSEVVLEIKMNNEVTFTRNIALAFQEGYFNTKNISNFGAFTLPNVGTLEFRVLHNDVELRNYVVKVITANEAKPHIVSGVAPL